MEEDSVGGILLTHCILLASVDFTYAGQPFHS